MFRRSSVLLCACFVSLAAPLHAASPNLGGIMPRGGQRGTEVPVTFSGARLADAQEIIVYYPGITAANLKVVNDTSMQVTFKLAPECRLGEHAFRVRTASGISEMLTFYVGALPCVDEKEPNSDFAAPQKLPPLTPPSQGGTGGVTVHGVADNEDVDYYLIEANKGQRITAEVEGMRLGTTLFDPYVAIMDMKRFELAASDDAALLGQDCVASVIAPADGTYVIQVRETSYGGNGGCRYRLHVGTFPRPLAVLPAGGKLGEEVEVTFLGDAAGEFKQKIKLPPPPGPPLSGGGWGGLFAQDASGIAPSANSFRLSDVGNVIEVEPNDAPPQATKFELPNAINGCISKAGDVDFFKFTAKKGQVYDIHCYARRIRSALDSVIILHGVASNDDAVGPDSYMRVTIPADQEYLLEIRDHLGKGGPHYTYRVEFTPVVPKLSVTIPKTDIFGYSQDRQTIPVPRGNRYATLIAANRVDFGGPLVLGAEGLPKGLTMHADRMHPSVAMMPVVFEAAADAPVAGALAQLNAKHADPNTKIAGGFLQPVMLVAQGNVGVFWKHDLDRAAVAVTQEVPFKINIIEPKAPLVQNGSMNLKIIAERKDGFKAPIVLQNLFNPPGVGSAANITIPEGQNEALYPINANGGAAVGKWKIAILAQATLPSPAANAAGSPISPGGPVWVSSQLATLEVAAPFVAFTMERDAVEQGKQTDLHCKVTVNAPFEGPAKVKLVGLPHLVTAPDMDITKDTKEFAFKVKTDQKSPPGQHKNLFCQVVVTHNGEPVFHNVGYSELRIDPPPPPKPMATAPAPPPPAANAAGSPAAKLPEKRLTRLEKLRLEQEEREKAGKPPEKK